MYRGEQDPKDSLRPIRPAVGCISPSNAERAIPSRECAPRKHLIHLDVLCRLAVTMYRREQALKDLPGPKHPLLTGMMVDLVCRRDPHRYVTELAETYGPIFKFRLLIFHVSLANWARKPGMANLICKRLLLTAEQQQDPDLFFLDESRPVLFPVRYAVQEREYECTLQARRNVELSTSFFTMTARPEGTTKFTVT